MDRNPQEGECRDRAREGRPPLLGHGPVGGIHEPASRYARCRGAEGDHEGHDADRSRSSGQDKQDPVRPAGGHSKGELDSLLLLNARTERHAQGSGLRADEELHVLDQPGRTRLQPCRRPKENQLIRPGEASKEDTPHLPPRSILFYPPPTSHV